MIFPDIVETFDRLKGERSVTPTPFLGRVGRLAEDCLRLLRSSCRYQAMSFVGIGAKSYVVAVSMQEARYSRPLRNACFVADPGEFAELWGRYEASIVGSAGAGYVDGVSTEDCSRACYTAAMAYAAVIDLYRPRDRGSPGVFLEMVVGPSLALLLDAPEERGVRLDIDGVTKPENIPVDLIFPVADDLALAVPTKISTRERISQAFVHQRILEAARPGAYRTVLVAINETNIIFPRGTPIAERTLENASVKETLVPGTIALYEKYVAAVAGLYYMDPPAPYLDGRYVGLPPVKNFGELLTTDLPGLVSR